LKTHHGSVERNQSHNLTSNKHNGEYCDNHWEIIIHVSVNSPADMISYYTFPPSFKNVPLQRWLATQHLDRSIQLWTTGTLFADSQIASCFVSAVELVFVIRV